MHDETIPAPLTHRDLAKPREAPSNQDLVLKLAVGGVIALFVLVPLLRG